jgi:hypothetical protein
VPVWQPPFTFFFTTLDQGVFLSLIVKGRMARFQANAQMKGVPMKDKKVPKTKKRSPMKGMVDVAAPTFFDASGKEVKDRSAQLVARVIPGIQTATACLELHGVGNGGSVTFEIQVIVNPNTYPFLILGGSIRGDICTVRDQWVVTGGSFGPHLVIAAKRVPLANSPNIAAFGGTSCATDLRVVGFFQAPDSYAGSYGTNGSDSDFSHTTLFKGWHACP